MRFLFQLIRPCCGLATALGVMSCSTVPQGAVESGEAPRKMAIQPETKWPTSAPWWNNPDATALVYSSSIGNEDAATMEAKVVAVNRCGAESTLITFRPASKGNLSITLLGPARLEDYLGTGLEVSLGFDGSGRMTGIFDMPSLKSWTRSGNRHRIELTPRRGKTFRLFVLDKQLFYGIGDLPAQKSESEMARQYDEWEGLKNGKRYDQLTQSEKSDLFDRRVGFEVSLTPEGIYFTTGEGYGGGPDAEPEWVLPASASEGFE